MRIVHILLGTNPSRQRRLLAATASQSGKTIRERRSLLMVVSLVIALTFILVACGATTGSGSGSTGSSPLPTATATTGSTNSTSDGCPSNTAVSSKPAPNVTVNLKNMNSTVTAHVADIVEIDLPFGHMWNGPTSSQGTLTLQQPAGFAWSTNKVCVWRFTVQNTGTTQLTFTGRPICTKGLACPQYIMQVPFTIEVK